MPPKDYSRDANGLRFAPGSMVTVRPADMLASNEFRYLQNVRGYLQDRITDRATQSSVHAVSASGPVYSVRRLNDTTPLGPALQFVNVAGAASQIWVNSTSVASGFSGDPVSLIPFRPNASVQPWMYVGDRTKMVKVRSDGLTYKTGIAEPQAAPTVGTSTVTTTGTVTIPATSPPWTNNAGANFDYNYSGTDVTSPVIVATPIVGATVAITVTGTAMVSGISHAPGDAGSVASGFPGSFITGAKTVVGAFTNGAGDIVPIGGGPVVVSIGASASFTVPPGATQLQIGVDSHGGTFAANSGSFAATWTLSTSGVATKISTLGEVTAYVWGTPPPAGGGSPHSGPVASYIWKNPSDTGSGTARSITNPVPDGAPTNNSWHFDSTPEDGTVAVDWSTLNPDGSTAGSIPLFEPLETQGFQDFNCCVVGNLFVPAAGVYSISISNKDQVLFGIGGGATVAGGFVKNPTYGQTKTVISGLPLMLVTVPDGDHGAVSTTLVVTFPAQGVYAMEADWDYWKHTGRKLIIQIGGADIPPLQEGVRTDTSYVGVYRSSQTGAVSNPSPASVQSSLPVLSATVSIPWSSDPQVDRVDYYRQDASLANYTYVATGPNTNPPTPIADALSDLAAATNPILQTDNFEPFPSIDLPHSGVLSVVAGTLTRVSGDLFNVRWLPGTIIQIGSPTQLAYSLFTRPVSTSTMLIPEVPDGTNLVWNIAEPILAAQPLPSMWGPTDNVAYMFACGDFLRPGTLYFTKGNNPDSAPDTNQIEVTSPSEPLMNGCIVNGIGMVFSTEHAWLCYPTFTTALATVSGVQGQPFNLILSITNRGLYLRNCLCTDGSKTVFFRAKDGIYASPGGAGAISITDDTIYNLFPHEGIDGQNQVVGNGFTVYAPNDAAAEQQQLNFANGYLYYDYLDSTNTPRTLVYDVIAKGWSVDQYAIPVITHQLAEGPNVNNTLMGCTDGTARMFVGGHFAEATFSVVMTGAVNAGDDRANKRLGDVFIKALVRASHGVTLALYSSQYAQALTGYSPVALTGTGTLQKYLVDFTDGFARDVDDIEMSLLWATGAGNVLDLWQPTFLALPETTQSRPMDWDDMGTPGNKFIQGLLVEADSFGLPKSFLAQRSDDKAVFIPNESPATFLTQTVKAFSFTPPWLAHLARVITTDGVPWNTWRVQWIFKPYPEQALMYATEGTTHGLFGWQHAYMCNLVYLSANPVTVTFTTDQGVFTQTWPATATGVLDPVKILKKLPRNKFKIIDYAVTSSAPFYLWKELMELWVRDWGSNGAYSIVKPFGGPSALEGAEV